MYRSMMFIAAAIAVAALSTPANAQSASAAAGAAQGAQPVENHLGQNNMTQEQYNQFIDYVDQAKRLTKGDKAKGKTLKDLLLV
jgi:hypothetical protein